MFPEIITERFLLRKIIDADLAKIFEGLSHTDVIRHYGVSYTTLESAKEQMDFYNDLLLNETGIWWAVCHKNMPNQLIGACGFNNWHRQHRSIEIGYWLLAGEQGSGIMTESIAGILPYAFNTLNVHRVEAVVEEGNDRSTRLLTRLGFTYEGTRKECEIKNGVFISLLYFALIKIEK